MKKKQMTIIIALIVLLLITAGAIYYWGFKKGGINPFAAPADLGISLSPTSGTVLVGNTLDVSINVTNPSGTAIDAASAVISYDPTYIEIVDADVAKAGIQVTHNATYFPNLISNFVDTTNNKIILEAGVDLPASGDPVAKTTGGTLGTIKIKAKQSVASTGLTLAFQAGSTNFNYCMIAEHLTGNNVLGSIVNASYTFNYQTTLNLTLSLQGKTSLAADGAKLEVYSVGATTPTLTKNDVTINTAGQSTFNLNIAPGNYDIKLKVPYFLATKKTNITTTSSTSIDFGQQLTGDINNDNMINILDYSAMLTAWRKQSSDAGYNAAADLKQDNQINILDYSMMVTNWRKQGA